MFKYVEQVKFNKMVKRRNLEDKLLRIWEGKKGRRTRKVSFSPFNDFEETGFS